MAGISVRDSETDVAEQFGPFLTSKARFHVYNPLSSLNVLCLCHLSMSDPCLDWRTRTKTGSQTPTLAADAEAASSALLSASRLQIPLATSQGLLRSSETSSRMR
jgi:hypothetical protein